jgi:Mg-chelatase subunit ChlD
MREKAYPKRQDLRKWLRDPGVDPKVRSAGLISGGQSLAFSRTLAAVAAVWLVAFTSILTAVAEEPDGVAIEIASVDQAAPPNLSAVINVLDATGRPISSLDRANFDATIDGQPATVEGLQSVVDSRASLSVILVVDSSGSMAGEPLAAAQTAATEFINELSPQDSVTVFAFSDEVTVAQEPATDKTSAIGALQGLAAAGNTALFEATSRAVIKTAELPSARRAIVLLSDGVDYGGRSSVTRDDSIAQARFVGVPVYTIGLGSEIDRNYLTELAQATGARFLEAPSPAGLSQLYGDIGAVLRGQYIISLQSPSLDPASPHTLELSVSLDGVTATASKGIAATAPIAQPPATPSQVDNAATEATATSGGRSKMLLFAGLLIVVVGGGSFVFRRRRPRVKRHVVEVRLKPWSGNGAVAGSMSLQDDAPLLQPDPTPVEEPGGMLVVVNGPDAGKEYLVGTSPLSIGSATWCDLKVADEDGEVGPEEARAWVHQDKLIFHRLTRLSLLATDGSTGGWLILEDGDEVSVGHLRLHFVSLAPARTEETSINEAVNDAVQQLATRATNPGITSVPSPSRLWPVDDAPEDLSDEEGLIPQSLPSQLPPTDDQFADLIGEEEPDTQITPSVLEAAGTEGPAGESDTSSSPPRHLFPVDDTYPGVGSDEEDLEPPALAMS